MSKPTSEIAQKITEGNETSISLDAGLRLENKKRFIWLSIASFVSLVIIGGISIFFFANGGTTMYNCKRAISLESSSQSGIRGKILNDRNNQLLNLSYPVDGIEPADSNANLKLSNNEYLLYQFSDEGDYFFNSEYFETLNYTDVTKDYGEKKIVAQIKEEKLKEFGNRQIIDFLIKTEVVSTYSHLNSSLCMIQENESDQVYSAVYKAEHEYCTNECQRAKYQFEITIQKDAGEIFVSHFKSL